VTISGKSGSTMQVNNFDVAIQQYRSSFNVRS
jgi:hypothetical protein